MPAPLPPKFARAAAPWRGWPLLALALAGCGAEAVMGPMMGPGMVLGGGSVVLTGRTPVDHAASYYWGRDCSVVRLERRESWCADPPAPPPPVPYCTRSLGTVDCWAARPFGAGRQVADPPGP